jgi:hypothetical protein
MSRSLKFIIAGNLVVLAVLAFVFPHLMVGPGKLIPGHQKLEADCFACHASFTGASSPRCVTCHKPADVGRLTTAGQPVTKPLTSTPFHQKDARAQCQDCHKSPTDSLHQQITGNCSQCHNQDKWTPATFDHDKYFALDRDHNTRCVTCHVRNDYSRYTCYGCHEHTPANIRAEHIKEGIREYEKCVECHRSADEHDIRMPGRGAAEGGREGGGGRRKDHDD